MVLQNYYIYLHITESMPIFSCVIWMRF
uniref:Uncharacterized protein n=1 Tax=Rhizophora mucronata TaxID=61149 RepID=A0A2P2NME7_RHIMU